MLRNDASFRREKPIQTLYSVGNCAIIERYSIFGKKKGAFNMIKKPLLNGICAGIFIGIGGSVFLSCDNRYIGAFFFSIALLSICTLDLHLFTGKIGFVVLDHTKSNIISVLFCLLGNLAGTVLASLIVSAARPPLVDAAKNLAEAKLALSLPAVFFSAILCGILMYTAVKIYKDKNTVVGILFCVPVFILSGFEHSIADMFYLFLAFSYTPATALFLLTVILGNTVGGMLIPFLKKLAE